MNEYELSQDIIDRSGLSNKTVSAFDMRRLGHLYLNVFRYDNEKTDNDMHVGWDLAGKLIELGDIFYVHNFHKIQHECSGTAYIMPDLFPSHWYCNKCEIHADDKEWWKIRVFMDGNEWCCIGTGFESLQESNNYAFGETREEAINNYGMLMRENKK